MILLLTYRFGRNNHMSNNIYKTTTSITFPYRHRLGYSICSTIKKSYINSYSQNGFSEFLTITKK